MRFVLAITAAFVASAVVAGLTMPVIFYVIAGAGQYMDPTAPGDEWIFLGGVGALIAGVLGALATFFVVGGLGLRWATSKPADADVAA